MLGEPAGVGMMGVLRAVVPLAECPGGVAGGEGVGDRLLIEVEPFESVETPHPAPGMVPPCEVLGPRRRADGADKEPVEQRLSSRQSRCSACSGLCSHARSGRPPLVVGQDDDDVGPLRRRGVTPARVR